MPNGSLISQATHGCRQVPQDWMPASGVEPLVLGDPALVWLKYHGEGHGFHPERSPYAFLEFIAEKARQFEDRWMQKMVPRAVRICTESHQVRFVGKVWETLARMQAGTPVLAQPALWWAPERIYGTPDLLVHTSWLQAHCPRLLNAEEPPADAPNLARPGWPGHYVVFDLKYTSELDSPQKAQDLQSYAAQVRLYSYMVGHLQGLMPQRAYLLTRDRIFDPIPVEITSELGRPLDADLAALRDQFVEIKTNGARYLPWRDAMVASNLAHWDEPWRTAKRVIAEEKTPGRDPGIVYQIGPSAKEALAGWGYATLHSLLQADPAEIPFEQCDNLGPANAQRIRAILQANRCGSAVIGDRSVVPPRKEFEFYVDFEYFSNVNADFDREWPTLDGCEMIFMVGLGWERAGAWTWRCFVAPAEDPAGERALLERFIRFVDKQTAGAFLDPARTVLYHWTGAEVWQAQRAADRQHRPGDHALRRLPWSDLQRVFLDAPIGLPGAWTYKLKEVTRAVARLSLDLDLAWPDELDQGLQAMVMGWRAYQTPQPQASEEMAALTRYLEADCRALWGILRWLRASAW